MKNFNKVFVLMAFALLGLLNSCSDTPVDNPEPTDSLGVKAAYILCEGTWGGNNSTLSRYDFTYGKVIGNYYSYANNGLVLGDLANSMVIYGNYGYIAVSTSKTVEAVDMKTGKSAGRLVLDGDRQPRRIVIVNDSTGYVTDLNQSSVIKFNTKTMSIIDEIKVGPAPEGIAYHDGRLFVANSGYGDLKANEPDAGTVYVIDETTLQLEKKLTPGPNVIDVVVNAKNNRLYAKYHHLYSKPDSLGGIVEYDLSSLEALHDWRDSYGSSAKTMEFSSTGDTLFYVNSKGIGIIDIEASTMNKEYLTNTSTGNTWYSLAISPFDGTLWIGNAKNFMSAGEVLVYSLSPSPAFKFSFTTGIVPNTIVFFE